MALVVVVLVGAVVLGWVLGGRARRLVRLPVASWPLAALAVGTQLGGGLAARATGSGLGYVVGSVASTALVLAFCVRNRTLHGVPLVALGLLLNAFVVTSNGAMPVSATAARQAGVDVWPVVTGTDPRHTLIGPGTALRPLADRIPLALPRFPEVLSVGDVLVTAGLALLVVMGMTSGARYDDGMELRPVRPTVSS
jgi:Family of unknown function (DUF5317)